MMSSKHDAEALELLKKKMIKWGAVSFLTFIPVVMFFVLVIESATSGSSSMVGYFLFVMGGFVALFLLCLYRFLAIALAFKDPKRMKERIAKCRAQLNREADEAAKKKILLEQARREYDALSPEEKARRRQEEERQLQEAEQQRRRESDTYRRCGACAYWSDCTLRMYPAAQDCTAFRPRVK